jgi:hypothetical protein
MSEFPSHNVRLSSLSRGYFIFLIDQSGSMCETFGNEATGMTLAGATARMINNWIEEMILEATKGDSIKDWFDLSVVGYRTDSEGNPIVSSAFTGSLAGRESVTIPELANNILFEEEVQQKFYNPATAEIEVEMTEKPGWVHPVTEGGTPFSMVLLEAHRLSSQWIEAADHREKCLPPIVINVTDAEYSEDDGIQFTPEDYAESLKDLRTNDGNVLLFTCQLSPNPSDAILCPDSIEQLPTNNFARMMFRMSSELPPSFAAQAAASIPDLRPGARCLAYNASDTSVMIRFFKMGTLIASPKNLR